jgi:hypothetical protein
MRASNAQVKEKGDQEGEVEILPNPIGLTLMRIMRREGSRISRDCRYQELSEQVLRGRFHGSRVVS